MTHESNARQPPTPRENYDMTDTTPPALVVSCAPYTVTAVEGRAPRSLHEFEGTISFVVDGPTGGHQIFGEGGDAHDGAVRFYEKDQEGVGKDVRVWTVSISPDRGFVAAC